MCIQLITCLPLPSIPATPSLTGFLNSVSAPPELLNTMPKRSFTRRLPNAVTGSILSSHNLQVSPRNSPAGGSVSTNPSLPGEGSSPYQPMADAYTLYCSTVCVCVINRAYFTCCQFVFCSFGPFYDNATRKGVYIVCVLYCRTSMKFFVDVPNAYLYSGGSDDGIFLSK